MPNRQIQSEKRIDDLLMERQRLDQDIKERYGKTVAILFSDISGYTQYTEKKGDLLSRYMLLRHNQIIFPAIKRNHGKVIQVMGDGILAVFHSPLRAVSAAVDIQQSLNEANASSSVDDEIHVKIGIHMGEVLLDEETEIQGLTGDTANVAARLQDYAGPDEILISRAVHEKIENADKWLCRFHGEVVFKGKSVSTPIYRVMWTDGSHGQGKGQPYQLVQGGKSDDTKVGALVDNVIVTLEFHHDGKDLSISMHEKRQGEESTLRHYESISLRTEMVEKHCKVLVKSLNEANRQGQVSGKTLDRLREIGQALYDELLSLDVKERLNQTKADTLILSIDDRLVHIPWELLYDGRQFFCMRFSMGRVVKTRQTPVKAAERPLEAPLDMLVLADPTRDLKNAQAEGAQICNFLDQRRHLINATMPKKPMTAESLTAKLRNFDLIHFAGHAHHDTRNPASGGWRLKNSNLTTDDIARMAGGASMPTMVFANACQSARTDQWVLDDAFEYQIFGMANAFLLSGVKHYIGTFWEIMDEPGSHFAIEFYKQLFSGRSVGRSVLEARRALVALYGEETIIWASYVFYGDPTFDYAAHIKKRPKQAEKKGRIVVKARPTLKDATREKRGDPATGRELNGILRWGALAIAAVLFVVSAWWAVSWYKTRSISKMEQQAYDHCLSGENDEAIQICRKLQKVAPERPTSSLILGDIHFASGKLDDARKYFKNVVDDSVGSNEARIKAYLGLGRLASMESRSEAAMAYYKKAAGIDPDNVHAISAQAVLLERQGQFEEAYHAYTRAAALSSDDSGFQVAANQIGDRLELMKDERRQTRIDRLVQDILSDERPMPDETKDDWSSKPLTIWMLDFQTGDLSLQEGKDRLIHGLLGKNLMNNPRIRLVERAFLDKVLSELKLGSSPMVDRDAALEVGRLVSARILLIGRIMHSQHQLQATIRMVESETGLVLDSVMEGFDRHTPLRNVSRRIATAVEEAIKQKYPVRAQITTVGQKLAMIDIGRYQGAHHGMVLKGEEVGVVVQIRSVGLNHSKVDIVAGKEYIRSGLRLEENGDI